MWRSGCRPNISVAALSCGGASLARPWLCFHIHRVGGGGHPPPPPTERSVRISRTTLFGRWFTALWLLFVARRNFALYLSGYLMGESDVAFFEA
jgi:hypothetical protein